MMKSVFVTVGTTKFDKLVERITKDDILKLLREFGIGKLVIQIGEGMFIPKRSEVLEIEYYRLKESILEDMRAAEVVVSHCGAGSCLEGIAQKKRLIAVVNEDLMNNHQVELAKKLYEKNLLFYCTCSEIMSVLKKVLTVQCVERYQDGQMDLFSDYLNKSVGFCG